MLCLTWAPGGSGSEWAKKLLEIWCRWMVILLVSFLMFFCGYEVLHSFWLLGLPFRLLESPAAEIGAACQERVKNTPQPSKTRVQKDRDSRPPFRREKSESFPRACALLERIEKRPPRNIRTSPLLGKGRVWKPPLEAASSPRAEGPGLSWKSIQNSPASPWLQDFPVAEEPSPGKSEQKLFIRV